MKKRNLSGIYFRHQESDGSWDNRVFEDISEEKQDKLLENRDAKWLRSMCKQLGNTIRKIGDRFDIMID